MTKDYPYVPRVAFIARATGEPHVVCGNGAHYVWEAGRWTEVQPLPHSLRWQQWFPDECDETS